MHYVYVLQNKTERYIGYPNNLIQRLKQHQKRKPWKLIYYEAYRSEISARQRENKLKHYGSAWRALKKRINA